MKVADLLLLVAAGSVLYAVTRRRKPPAVVNPAPPEPAPVPEEEPQPEAEVPPDRGIELTQHGLALRSMDRWFAIGPAGFDAALNEGYTEPEEMVNEAFRKLYPEQTWPPKWGEPRYAIWRRIVYALESAADKGHRQGLHVVDHG